jgi:hypothetical protein
LALFSKTTEIERFPARSCVSTGCDFAPESKLGLFP